MTAIRQTRRKSDKTDTHAGNDIGGSIALMGLRVVLLGCAFALVGVLGHVAWKVANV